MTDEKLSPDEVEAIMRGANVPLEELEARAEASVARLATALASGLAEPADNSTAGWLVERPQRPNAHPTWWHPQGGWLIEATDALRFARKEDANAYIKSMRFGEGCIATEHVWFSGKLLPKPRGHSYRDYDLTPGVETAEAVLEAIWPELVRAAGRVEIASEPANPIYRAYAAVSAWRRAMGAGELQPRAEIMTEDQIKHMVDRFLGWHLPDDFHPDNGISFKPTFNDHLPTPTRHDPSGTNLFDATQAEAMVRYLVEGL